MANDNNDIPAVNENGVEAKMVISTPCLVLSKNIPMLIGLI